MTLILNFFIESSKTDQYREGAIVPIDNNAFPVVLLVQGGGILINLAQKNKQSTFWAPRTLKRDSLLIVTC